jgi:catechol 2,3-dioxygenase-like lactoylglutathione lyase family enzyme
MSISEALRGFHDLTIVASNVAELRSFYGRLGFRQVLDHGNLAVFLVGSNELAIHASGARPSEALVLSILVNDLGLIERNLSELSVAFEGPAQMRPGLVGIRVRDPNGNKIEFVTPEAS